MSGAVIVELCHSIGGTYGGDDNGYGAAAAQADWDADFIVECRVTDNGYGEAPMVEPLRIRDDIKGSEWRPFEGSPLDDDNAYADMEHDAQLEIQRILDGMDLPTSEWPEMWGRAFDKWAKENEATK